MLKFTPKDAAYILLYAIPNTLLSFMIIYIINNAVAGHTDFLKDYMSLVFVATIAYTYLLNIAFQKKLNQHAFRMLYNNEKQIFNRILQTPLRTLERLGSQRFYTAVEDLRVFAWLPETITHTVNSLLMLSLCLVYLFTLSMSAASIVVGLIGVLVGVYLLVLRTMSKKLTVLREYNEDYYEYVDDVTKGFKELKMSGQRRKNLMQRFLIPNRESSEKLDFTINYIFLSINLISQYGLYFVVGIILFVLPEFGILNRTDVISYVVIILFITGPVNSLINMQNMYTRFLVSNRRINKFLKDFAAAEAEPQPLPPSIKSFESVEFRNLCFAYRDKNGEATGFALGPIDLKIREGETLFVIGGNGSGKSTFINILTGLYQPSRGEMLVNGIPLESNQDFQPMVASVFTNNHLFAHNYEEFTLKGNDRYRELLETMQLEGIVKDDQEKSARRGFSKGQSKRMSMIFALLEDKPVLVLDEWAADQDPHFRKFFYEELLPELKRAGKTVIAVTHDDAYFKHADRIVKFNYGRIEKDLRVSDEVLEVESLW